MNPLMTIISAIVGSTAVASLIQFFVARHDSRAAVIDKIADDVKELRVEFRRGRAISARIRILDANDEVLHGAKHSKEWWDQVLDDVTFYDQYCTANPDFRNAKAVHAKENLERIYVEVMKKNEFI